MRKFNLLLVIAFCFLQLNANAENSKTVSVSFDKKDFNLSYDEKGMLYIGSNVHSVDYGTDFTVPGLPMVPINVLIPNGYTYQDVSVSQSKTLYLENVEIKTEIDGEAKMPTLLISTLTGTREATLSVNSASVTYNASNLKAGIYIVSLYVDGKLVDSTRLIKE